jgi:prepilin-type N-terminal cleavage/methylation domain-containing protein
MKLSHKKFRNTERSRGEAGFTIVEILVAIVILTIGLLAMANMHVLAMFVNSSARNVTESTALAQSRLEELIHLPFDNAELAPTGGFVDEAATVGIFTVSKNIQDLGNNIRRIDIRVRWREIMSRQTELSFVRSSTF